MEKRERAVLSGEIKTILKRVSRTLYLSVKILPEPVKTHMGLGYLLCRAMDTVVDTPGVSEAAKLEILALMRGIDKPANAAALVDKVRALASAPSHHGERELLQKFAKIAEVYEAFPQSERRFFAALLDGVASGMEMDVRSFPAGQATALKTQKDLEFYCGCMGGEPGRFWARLYREAIRNDSRSVSHFPSEDDAFMIGSALQMTNVLKDMAADIRIGRCYIPQEDLDGRGLKPADLADPENMERLREITNKWMFWALDRFDQSEAFVAAIPKTELALRAAVIWPVYWAMDTLAEAAHSNLIDPAGRPRIRRSRIYSTIAATPPLLLSNTAFARGYRFRRETLIVSITRGQHEGRAI